MQALPTYEALQRPLPKYSAKSLYYKSVRLAMTTVGRLSKGVQIGLKYGFDSGVMLEYVYQNKAQGVTWIGQIIDRVYLNSVGWRGIRQRGDILKRVLKSTITETYQLGHHTKLLDVACGGGRYDLEVLANLPPDAVVAVLRDYKLENVESARSLARQLGVTARIEQANAFSDEDLRLVDRPNLVVVSGLHEIFPDDDLIRHHFQQISRILQPGGHLICTVQPYHPQLELIARSLNSHTGNPWVMRLRSVEQIQHWASDAGFGEFELTTDSFGIFGVMRAKKIG
jgi:SAM-dependent methyltransferase